MGIKATVEEYTQGKAVEEFWAHLKSILGIVFLVSITILGTTIIFALLSFSTRVYITTLIMLPLVTLLALSSLFLYLSPIFSQLLRRKAQPRIDMIAIINEQRTPTKKVYKIRRNLLLILSIGSLVILVVYGIYLGIIINFS